MWQGGSVFNCDDVSTASWDAPPLYLIRLVELPKHPCHSWCKHGWCLCIKKLTLVIIYYNMSHSFTFISGRLILLKALMMKLLCMLPAQPNPPNSCISLLHKLFLPLKLEPVEYKLLIKMVWGPNGVFCFNRIKKILSFQLTGVETRLVCSFSKSYGSSDITFERLAPLVYWGEHWCEPQFCIVLLCQFWTSIDFEWTFVGTV